jgi:hypothetical protein
MVLPSDFIWVKLRQIRFVISSPVILDLSPSLKKYLCFLGEGCLLKHWLKNQQIANLLEQVSADKMRDV